MLAEARVADVLGAAGWQVLDRNWRGGGGELDLVVCRDESLRFVEVKLRAQTDDSADEAITASKRSKLRSAARAWMAQRQEDWPDLAFLVAIVRPEGEVVWTDDAFA